MRKKNPSPKYAKKLMADFKEKKKDNSSTPSWNINCYVPRTNNGSLPSSTSTLWKSPNQNTHYAFCPKLKSKRQQ